MVVPGGYGSSRALLWFATVTFGFAYPVCNHAAVFSPQANYSLVAFVGIVPHDFEPLPFYLFDY